MKYTIAQLKDPTLRISLAPMTKEQHAKVVAAVGYGCGWVEKYYYRFFGTPNCGESGSFGSSYLQHRIDHIKSLREITFDQIDFQERKIIGYKAPYILFEGAISKGSITDKSQHNTSRHYSLTTDQCCFYLPAEWVERDWEPVYQQTVELNGVYTLEELEAKVRELKEK